VHEADHRTLTLPPEGLVALQTVLGIIEDHDLLVDPEAYYRITMTLHEAVTAAPLGTSGDSTIEIDIAQADLLLGGLSFTEAMSLELPWYPMVIDAVRFVGDALLGLWSPGSGWPFEMHGAGEPRRTNRARIGMSAALTSQAPSRRVTVLAIDGSGAIPGPPPRSAG
jgi:hypothetical protein